MTTSAVSQVTRIRRRAPVFSWRLIAGGTMIAGGAAVVAGCLLPWAEVFAGLIGIAGIRGSNGKLLAAGGALIVITGLWHLIRGGAASRWLAGIAGAAVLGFGGFLLMRLSATMGSLGADSMMAARSGPGLWVVAGGGLAAFGTLFFPQSGQHALIMSHPAGGLAAWSADRESTGPRRWVQLSLGALWLVDAGLQAQPYMFSRGFATQVIGGAGMGNPAVLSNSIMGVSRIVLAHPAIFNGGFVAIQLALGLGLFWRRTVRAALAGTIVWAVAVWWLAEGLGGILTPTASVIAGAPGAALLYALIAVLAWPPRDQAASGWAAPSGTVAASSPAGPLGARLIWLVIWVGAAGLTLLGLARTPGSLRVSLAAGGAAGEPGWLGTLDRTAAQAAGSDGATLPIALAALFMIIAAGGLIPAARRPVLVLAVVTALAMWIIGQNFGGILTGRGTDPNTGPLLILLAATFWPARRLSGRYTAG